MPSTTGRCESAPVRAVYRSALHPALVVVDKENGGKADALNAGMLVASGDLFVALDADTIVAPDALLRMARAFLERPGTVAVGGTIRPVNGDEVADGRVVRRGVPRGWLAAVQSVEYTRAFFIGRLGWNRLGGNVIISGAFGTFHRGAVIAVGGYQHGSIGEDFELVVRLRRNGVEQGTSSRVQFLPDLRRVHRGADHQEGAGSAAHPVAPRSARHPAPPPAGRVQPPVRRSRVRGDGVPHRRRGLGARRRVRRPARARRRARARSRGGRVRAPVPRPGLPVG